jgi:hypothetical protein
MKFRIYFLVVVISLFFIASSTEMVFSQKASSCQPFTVCVHPGDILKYSITVNAVNHTQIYNFLDMMDSSHIRVIEQNLANKSNIQNTNSTLNIKTGFLHNEQDPTIVKPFFEILASPVAYNKSDTSITQKVANFNGFKRESLEIFHSSENSTSIMGYDIETGILLYGYSAAIITIGGNPQIVDFSNELIYTNLINSNSTGIQPPKNVISIPSWVKSTSKWWSQGQIQDSEFIKGIQYMISSGVMQIPHDSSVIVSSQPIPGWIKHGAGWWADGQISDDEFVKGIQWLISNGIIQI